jgi:DNA-binding response OmpR family regulator
MLRQRTQPTLLLADNSRDYRNSLRGYLELEDYSVVESDSVDHARQILDDRKIDLALVDLRLTTESETDFTGLELAKHAGYRGVPCIIVTAYPSVEAARLALRSRGAEALAEDFVSKYDGPQAVLDAINGVMSRRTAADSRQMPDPGQGLFVDTERKTAQLNGVHLQLSPRQYLLLEYLYVHAGRVCSRQELLQAVYNESVPDGQASADKRLERLVARLREKLGDDPHNPRFIVNVRGRGLQLNS